MAWHFKAQADMTTWRWKDTHVATWEGSRNTIVASKVENAHAYKHLNADETGTLNVGDPTTGELKTGVQRTRTGVR